MVRTGPFTIGYREERGGFLWLTPAKKLARARVQAAAESSPGQFCRARKIRRVSSGTDYAVLG
jgi:hypothetical protein